MSCGHKFIIACQGQNGYKLQVGKRGYEQHCQPEVTETGGHGGHNQQERWVNKQVGGLLVLDYPRSVVPNVWRGVWEDMEGVGP